MDRITVQRANVVLDISPEDKAFYMQQGYSVIDPNTGIVIEEALPNDVDALRTLVTKCKEEIASLKLEISELKVKSKKSKQ